MAHYCFSAYGFNPALVKELYAFSNDFFDEFGKKKNFSVLRAIDEQVDGDFDSFKMKKDQLRGEILDGVADNFRIMSSNSYLSPDIVSIGLLPARFSLINCFDVVFPVLHDDGELMKRFFSRIDDLVGLIEPNYAFLCEMKTAANAALYPSFPDNVVALRNERPSLVVDYIRDGGVFLDKLRMVYHVNYINESHCQMDLNGKTLRDLVLSSGEWGVVSKIGENISRWEVSAGNIQKISDFMGASGLLCSWGGNLSGSKKGRIP